MDNQIPSIAISIILFLFAAILTVSFAPGALIAQEDEAVEYSAGTVVDISGNTVTIEETDYNFETGEETTELVTYNIMPDAELENIVSIREIKKGHDVEIDYFEEEGNKNIVYIYVYTEE